jgi:hypothetical protein
MENINIHYGFGEIKPEFRGDRVLYAQRPPVFNPPIFKDYTMNSQEHIDFTSRPNSKIYRTYIGVNANAKIALEQKWDMNDFNYDSIIVNQEHVDIQKNSFKNREGTHQLLNNIDSL